MEFKFTEAPTGSLGQGLSIGLGMSLAAKMDKLSYKTYVLLGDGELQEGQIWEAAMFASHHRLDNLIAIVDRNGLQQTGTTESIVSIEPIAKKWEAFGWEVFEVDGLDIKEIIDALDSAEKIRNKPKVIIAYTIKGKGVPIIEWKQASHTYEGYKKLEKILKNLEEE